jgi:hypothetical protein
MRMIQKKSASQLDGTVYTSTPHDLHSLRVHYYTMSLISLDCVIIHEAEQKKARLLYAPIVTATRNEHSVIR